MISDIIVVAAIILVIGGAVLYIVREKKRGKKCIGCPYANSCSKSNGKGAGNCCSCGEHDSEK